MEEKYKTMFELACEYEPGVLEDLAGLPRDTQEAICALGFSASEHWRACWLEGIHKQVIRVIKEGQRLEDIPDPNDGFAVAVHYLCGGFESPVDDPRCFDSQEMAIIHSFHNKLTTL